jgi:hypothetical protein
MESAMVDVGTGGRAPSLRADLGVELRRILRSPWDDLVAIGINAVLVVVLWLLLPQAWKDWLFTLQGPVAFALVLESWMLADVPATNMIGKDIPAMVPALDDPPRLRQLLRAKSVVLALVVGIPCAIVSLIIGFYDDIPTRGLFVALVLLTLPFGTSTIAAWLGMVAPYRPMPVRWRWEHRRPWRQTLRWATLLVVPYGWVPLISCVLLVPGILVGVAVGRTEEGLMTGAATVAATAVACAVSAIAFPVGLRVSGRLAAKRRDRIQALLADPAPEPRP